MAAILFMSHSVHTTHVSIVLVLWGPKHLVVERFHVATQLHFVKIVSVQGIQDIQNTADGLTYKEGNHIANLIHIFSIYHKKYGHCGPINTYGSVFDGSTFCW